jgi:hypothetical protein
MPRYIVEARHDPDQLACARVVQVFLATGSHYLTNADWGCYDGRHSAWLVVEAGSKDEARMVLPAAFRSEASVTELNRFTMAEVEDILASHRRRGAGEPAMAPR